MIALGAAAALTIAVWLFPRALPTLALDQALTRNVALARADSFFGIHQLAPASARTAVRFRANDSLETFVELGAGGHDSLNALIRGRDVAPLTWSVRAFAPGDVREARVDFAPDGRVVGFRRKLADADSQPSIAADSARRLAEFVVGHWIDDRIERWHFVSTSYQTKQPSGRIDQTVTFERADRRVGGAPIRLEVVIAGDMPVSVRSHVEIPESFQRRYAEMRSANDQLALIASLGILAIAIAGVVFLGRTAHDSGVRWREALIVGAAIGGLALASGLNDLAGSWYSYDTATSPSTFQATQVFTAVLSGVSVLLLVGLTLAAAELATRSAFPGHVDWWKLWRYRGTRAVAARVGGGYAASCVAFAYVAVFYLVTRKLLGWWVPSELLDDPNQIASPLPWISGIAASAQAGVWEESFFRALPLSLLSLWVGARPTRRWWMAAGVAISALVFGFAHSNYETWPAYSRGVEIFLDACFWGVLFINFGLIVTVIAHFVYDLVLFGLFAASGTALQYRISAAVIVLALLAPAIAVVWKWIQQRRLLPAPDDATFAAWRADETPDLVMTSAPASTHLLTKRAKGVALAMTGLALIVAAAPPRARPLGPRFTAERAQVLQVADSILRAHGGDPTSWKRLTTTATDTLAAWPRFVRANKMIPRARALATTFIPSAWWVVRYVHTTGTTQQRAEEWRVRLWPDGKALDIRHIIPDSVHRDDPGDSVVRRIALSELARERVETSSLRESEFKETTHPARRDVLVTYTDTAIHLPAGANAKAFVQVAGDEPLIARRTIELPETFLRADKKQETTRALVTGAFVLAMIGITLTGAVIITRRRAAVLEDGGLDRRATIVFMVAITLLEVARRMDGLPSQLFSYDTAEPWSRFTQTIGAEYVAVIVTSLFLFGLWLAFTALRRRVGIPMLRGEPSRRTSNDMLVAGVGLGALLSILVRLPDFSTTAMPAAPSTLLDRAWPMLGNIPGIPAFVIVSTTAIGIPILVVLGITRNRVLRALLVLVPYTVLIAMMQIFMPWSDATPLQVIGLTLLPVVLGLAFYYWGMPCAWSWIVAALAVEGLNGFHARVHAVTSVERNAGALTFMVAAVLIALVGWRTRSVGSTLALADESLAVEEQVEKTHAN